MDKQKWLDAIDKCLKQEQYGPTVGVICELCIACSPFSCFRCVCNDYAEDKGFSGGKSICVDLVSDNASERANWSPANVRPILKDMRRWLNAYIQTQNKS